MQRKAGSWYPENCVLGKTPLSAESLQGQTLSTGLLTLSHHHLPRPISLELTVAFKEENQVIR